MLDKASTVPDALAVLRDQRNQLADALCSVGRFSALAADSVNQTRPLWSKNFGIRADAEGAADAGPSPTRAESVPDVPVAQGNPSTTGCGDYGNLSLRDFRPDAEPHLFTAPPGWEGDPPSLHSTIGQLPSLHTHTNPLVVPYHWD